MQKRDQGYPITAQEREKFHALSQIDFDGNLISRSCYHRLRDRRGHASSVAILVLPEVVYWSRPIYLPDEAEPRRKRYKADLLQKDY
jgi:hypothetical protein